MRNFCTYFDANYLTRGLTLYDSLKNVMVDDFNLWILCLDKVSYEAIKDLNIQKLKPISLCELEQKYQGLLEVKKSRTMVEYYFTITPFWIQYVLFNKQFSLKDIAYVDADLFFYQSPQMIEDENPNASIMIVPHRFKDSMKELEKHGKYNVGFLFFKNDDNSRICLQWWADQCLSWCYDRVEDGRYADQKYLDVWPKMFQGVHTINNNGVGLAPWNIDASCLSETDEGIVTGKDDLVFFHFQGIKIFKRYLLYPYLKPYGNETNWFIKRKIYQPYINKLINTENLLKKKMHKNTHDELFGLKSIRKTDKKMTEKSLSGNNGPFKIISKFKNLIKICKGVIKRDIWIYIAGKII